MKGRYMKNKLLDYKYNLLEFLILLLVIFSLAVINTKLISNFENNMQYTFNRLNNDIVELSLYSHSMDDEFGTNSRNKFRLSESDLQQVLNLEEVNDAVLYTQGQFTDLDENLKSINNTSENGEIIGIDGYFFNFNSLPIQGNIDKYYSNLDVVGKYPTLGNNEILIPSSLCEYLNSTCDDILNTRIKIPLDTEKINVSEYLVVGYYDSDSDIIYTPYRPVIYSDLEIENLYNSYEDLEGIYNPEIFKNLENFTDAFGSGYSEMLIKTEDVEKTTTTISVKYPNIEVNYNKKMKSIFINNYMLVFIIEALVLVVLFVFSRKYIKPKKRVYLNE